MCALVRNGTSIVGFRADSVVGPYKIERQPSKAVAFRRGRRRLRIWSFRRPGGSAMQLASSDVAAGMKNRPLNEKVQRASRPWYGEPICWGFLPGRKRWGVRRIRNVKKQRGAHNTDGGSANGKLRYGWKDGKMNLSGVHALHGHGDHGSKIKRSAGSKRSDHHSRSPLQRILHWDAICFSLYL